MPTKQKLKCDCHKHPRQVCDICQGITGNEKDREPESPTRFGYHEVPIKKGVLGELSKIREELEELEDAEAQEVKILIHCELADLYGAVRQYAKRYGLKMKDLRAMEKLTTAAFRQGYR